VLELWLGGCELNTTAESLDSSSCCMGRPDQNTPRSVDGISNLEYMCKDNIDKLQFTDA
jgi:hypothetical protein